MKDSRHLEADHIDIESFQAWLAEDDGIRTGLLSTLLDAHLLFQEEYLFPETLRPLFEARWPGVSLVETWEGLLQSGLVEPCPGAALAVPGELWRPLSTALEGYLWDRPLCLPGGTISFRRLMAGFNDYCQTELRIAPEDGLGTQAWGGVAFRFSGRSQLILLRPDLMRLRALPEAHLLALCPLGESAALAAAAAFTREPALRNRLALYDVEGGDKINLTRAELFVYFERYLRHAHSLRMSPSPALTSSLSDGGLLNLHKG